ncbi:MAG: hypothetical protein F4Y31_08600 [Gammaproteobacteria bacterium]|nr:hypothetical protein [Gammaproteobacteria bacterium]MYF68096.1 hypothetical protein [Gammaproteobacteria bacterium]MYK37621.1 hypothetical protein [Gammaproteobacteria bacterium]
MDRREFLYQAGLFSTSALVGMPAAAARQWSEGRIRHLIPLSNHDSIRIKASFAEPQSGPRLKIGASVFPGRRRDSQGRFWSFHATGLESDTEYELLLQSAGGGPLAESWPLRTAPALDASKEHLRVLLYTCAGGPDDAQWLNGEWRFLPVATRRRLLRRALDFSPDIAIGVGDQTYFDQWISPRKRGGQHAANRERIYGRYGKFDRDRPLFGSNNEIVLTRCLNEQIASLYGTDFRSVPLILTQDDHDYFENDEGTDEFVTFPPGNFSARLGRAQQSLYFPEFLPDPMRPVHLAGSHADGISESYGSCRWGQLAEFLLYDCRRFISLAGPSARFVEEDAERWITARTRDESAVRHLVQVPSTPFGWTAGKWGEWYPDVLQADGSLGVEQAKPYWQSGWFSQHQRLLSAIGGQKSRVPVVVSGDLHAVAAGRLLESGGMGLDSPVNVFLSGSIGTGNGWPSNARGIGASPPNDVTIDERLEPVERNGFTILDIDPDGLTVRQFAWDRALGIEAIDTLEPLSEIRLDRK